MDFSQLEHAIKISESESINRASMDLYLTQSALNQQLLRLERELGVTLFLRSKAGVAATEAGTVFLDYARKILDLKRELTAIMNDFSEFKKGKLTIGLPTVRGYDLFTNVFPLFHEKYPLFTLEPLELPVRQQKFLLSKGDIDLAFMTLTQMDEPELVYTPIRQEEIFLVVPADDNLVKEYPDDTIDFQALRRRKFVLIYRDSTLRRLTDDIFTENGFRPDTLLETSNHQTIASLVSNGYACSIVPKMYFSDSSRVHFYHLPGRPCWTLCGAHKRNSYLSQPAKDLLQMVSDYWSGKGGETAPIPALPPAGDRKNG